MPLEEKNKKIEENLKQLILSLQDELNAFSLESELRNELQEMGNVHWVNETKESLEKIKDHHSRSLIELIGDKKSHQLMKTAINDLVDPRNLEIQAKFSEDLRTGISFLNNPQKNHPNQKINLLFLEHDFGDVATYCGFEDLEYKFEILSGSKYIKFNYNFPFFNPHGKLNYNPVLKPFNDLTTLIGEDKIHELTESFAGEEYFYNIKKLHLLNSYLSIHYCFVNLHSELKAKHQLFHDEVYVLANEHDCEQYSIFVI